MIKYKLIIAHRVYPGLAKDSYSFDDKFKIVKANLISLIESIKGIDTCLYVIFNGCPESYINFYKETIGQINNNRNLYFEYVITDKLSNYQTFGMQLDYLLKNSSHADYLYFSEDDYFYKQTAFSAMIDFFENNKDVDFITPLDHPDRYTHVIAEKKRCEVRINKDIHWRTCGTTCCTFMTRSSVLNKTKNQLRAYENRSGDGPFWQGLTKDSVYSIKHIIPPLFSLICGKKATSGAYGNWGYYMVLKTWRFHKLKLLFYKKRSLWGPIPTLAIHICDPSISPCSSDLLNELDKFR